MSSDIVESILDELNGRKGFDWWWDGLAPEIRVEIREELMMIVDHKLDGR